MSLHIVQTTDSSPASAQLRATVRDALEAMGRVEVLVPTFAQGLDVQKALARSGKATLGVGCTTPAAWAAERWEVFGDGTRPVEGSERLALAGMVLEEHADASPVPASRGALDALSKFVRDTLAWLPLANDGGAREGDPRVSALGKADRDFVSLAGRYRSELRARGLVEPCEIARDVPDVLRDAGAAAVPLVATGFSAMPYATRRLLCGMARDVEVTVVVCVRPGPAGRLAEALVGQLEEAATETGVGCDSCPPADATPAQHEVAPELAGLAAALFRTGEADVDVLHATGAVGLLEAAGPLAEGELVASAIEGLGEDARETVVIVADTDRAFRELAPKLAARGMHVVGARRRSCLASGQARSLLGFASLLARLSELDWPAPDSADLLGDMSWWPAHEVTDFLLSEVSGVDEARAWRIDAEFRGNRSLSPDDVFATLRRERSSSRACALATSSILRGRLDRAAAQLIDAAQEDGRTLSDDAVIALSAVRRAATALARMGILAEGDPRKDVPGGRRISLSRFVRLTEDLVRHDASRERLALGPEDAPRTVRICSRLEASALPAASADAVVACGLTAAEMPLDADEGAVSALEERLGFGPPPDPLDRARSSFAAAVAIPRATLLLERALSDADAAPAYPAVPLTELLACYGEDEGALPKGMPRTTLGEDDVGVATSAAGIAQHIERQMPTAPTGRLSAASRPLVLVPREGEMPLPDGVPSLSASQIESYLECPFKWFTLRRLGLQSVDAGFSAMETGSFAHYVLEETYSGLLEDAMRAQGLIAPDAPFDQLAVAQRHISGTAIGRDTSERARELLYRSFEEHLLDQFAHARKRSAQSLVPHTKRDESALERLRESLASLLSYDERHLVGFDPRYFELRFGGSYEGSQRATYAGVDLVGTVDRLDVAENGDAIVIDYKHKSPSGFSKEYDAFPAEGAADAASFVLPRRVQALIYAQVLRRQMTDLHIVGAVYLATREDAQRGHAIAGVVGSEVADRVLPEEAEGSRRARLVAGDGNLGFDEVLDETERRIAEALSRLREGHIEADPLDSAACSFCPVHDCERRLA